MDVNDPKPAKDVRESIFVSTLISNNQNLVKICLENGADVNRIIEMYNKTPLMYLLNALN